jgi:hypothetical protein
MGVGDGDGRTVGAGVWVAVGVNVWVAVAVGKDVSVGAGVSVGRAVGVSVVAVVTVCVGVGVWVTVKGGAMLIGVPVREALLHPVRTMMAQRPVINHKVTELGYSRSPVFIALLLVT